MHLPDETAVLGGKLVILVGGWWEGREGFDTGRKLNRIHPDR